MKKHSFFYIFILFFTFQATASAQDYSLFGLKGKVRTATITEEDDEKLMEIEFDEDGKLKSFEGYLFKISSDDWTRSGNSITVKDDYEYDEEMSFSYNPSCIDEDVEFAFASVEYTLAFKNGRLRSESVSVYGQEGGTWSSIQHHILETYTYLYDGNRIKKETFVSEYESGGHSGLISPYTITNQKKSSKFFTYTYTEFDKYGNWTKRKDQNGNIEIQKIT